MLSQIEDWTDSNNAERNVKKESCVAQLGPDLKLRWKCSAAQFIRSHKFQAQLRWHLHNAFMLAKKEMEQSISGCLQQTRQMYVRAASLLGLQGLLCLQERGFDVILKMKRSSRRRHVAAQWCICVLCSAVCTL